MLAAMSATAAGNGYFLDRNGWTWSTSSECAKGEDFDIAGLSGICDGDYSTCWHSNYKADNGTPERSNPHWVMIDRGEKCGDTPFYGLAYVPRQLSPANQACTKWHIYISDKSFADVPADNISNIQSTIKSKFGSDVTYYSGSWTGDLSMKVASFSKKETGRYILFVNESSMNSSSAACAEMALMTSEGKQKYDSGSVNDLGQIGGDDTGSGSAGGNQSGTGDDNKPITPAGYNAVKISTANGKIHRIAFDGENLKFAMTGDVIRMSNSGITVEYAMAEVSRFSFEKYEFKTDSVYYGTKKPIDQPRFDMVVTPAGGKRGDLSEIRLSAADNGKLPQVNADCVLPITLSRSTSNSIKEKLSVTAAQLKKMAEGDAYVIKDFYENNVQTYYLEVPAEMFINAKGNVSKALSVTWTLTGNPDDNPVVPDPVNPGGNEGGNQGGNQGGGEHDGIEEVEADCPTLTIRREGMVLHLGGMDGGSAIGMYDTAGRTVARVTADTSGNADIYIGNLGRGVYILSTNFTSLKISL